MGCHSSPGQQASCGWLRLGFTYYVCSRRKNTTDRVTGKVSNVRSFQRLSSGHTPGNPQVTPKVNLASKVTPSSCPWSRDWRRCAGLRRTSWWGNPWGRFPPRLWRPEAESPLQKREKFMADGISTSLCRRKLAFLSAATLVAADYGFTCPTLFMSVVVCCVLGWTKIAISQPCAVRLSWNLVETSSWYPRLAFMFWFQDFIVFHIVNKQTNKKHTPKLRKTWF
jgi:hypothetical protein